MTFREALKAWGVAQELVRENPRLLLLDDAKYTPICIERCENSDKTREKLFSFPKEEKSTEVLEWEAAEADRGCSSCWFSSFRNRQHKDCQVKIKRWFDAREALFVSAKKEILESKP